MVALGSMSRSAAAVLAGILPGLALMGACDGRTLRLGGVPSDGGGTCAHAQTSAAAVVWIGDSWILVPGNQVTGVETPARATHAIGPNDAYTIDAAPAATMLAVVSQYTTQQASGTPAQVLIMDGGTWDTLTANGSSASVTSVVNTFGQFLGKVASDGTVQDIIYFLQPDTVAGVPALRPPMQQACKASAVPCYFLDLQPLWSAHPEYAGSDNPVPVPSTAGGAAIANAIWAIMQANCIAQ
jgi:hypothetical protein